VCMFYFSVLHTTMALFSMLIGSLWLSGQHADSIAAKLMPNVVHKVVCNYTASFKAAAGAAW